MSAPAPKALGEASGISISSTPVVVEGEVALYAKMHAQTRLLSAVRPTRWRLESPVAACPQNILPTPGE